MRCNEVQARLSALLDNELPRMTAWRVQRHLHTCSRCAAMRTEIESISAAATNVYAEVAMPASLRTRFLHAAAATPPTAPVAARPARRFRRTKRTVAFASALVGLVGIGLGTTSLYFSAQPTPAYAEIAHAMQSLPFRTIHLQGEKTWLGKNDSVLLEYDVWGRTDSPAVAATIHGTDSPQGADTRKSYWLLSRLTQSVGRDTLRHFSPARKSVTRRKWLTAESLRKFLGQYSMNSFYASLPASGAASGSQFTHGMRWQSRFVLLNGRRLQRLEGSKGAWYLGPDSYVTVVLYADPQTHLLARSECTWHDHGAEQRQIWRSIRYNETPPPDVFEDAE